MLGNGISKFGRVALDLNFLNIKQLEECLQLQIDYQKEGKEAPRLGSLLLSKEYITSHQLEIILHKQKDAKYTNASASTSNILRNVNAGSYIYKEGDDSTQTLYLTHEGSIDIYRDNKLIEKLTGKGKFFGIVSYLTSTKYTESAVATNDSKVFAIPSNEVDAFLNNRPKMALKIAKKLAGKLYTSIVADQHTHTDNLQEEKQILETQDETHKVESTDDEVQSDINTRDSAINAVDLEPEVVTNKDSSIASFGSEIVDSFNFDNTVPPNDLTGDKLELKPLVNDSLSKSVLISHEVDGSDLIATIMNYKNTPFSSDIISVVKDQINLFLEIEEIDKERTAYLNSFPEKNEILKNEINKQRKEFTRIPPYDSLRNTHSRLIKILDEDASPKTASVNENEEYGIAQDENPHTGQNVKAKLDKSLKKAYQFSIKQKELLIKRYDSFPNILQVCSSYSVDEPLYMLQKRLNIDPTNIFGWGVYQMALKEYSDLQVSKIERVKLELQEFETNTSSLVGKFKFGKKIDEEAQERLDTLLEKEHRYKAIQIIVTRELNNIEKTMVEEFWKVYSSLAHLLPFKLSGIDKVMVKCFLRWGLLGYTPKWIDSERCTEFIKSGCSALKSPQYSTNSTYIYYADEVIELTAKGYIPTSPNEDLELNHRNSPAWRCDKAFKKHSYLTLQHGILLDVLKDQKEEISELATNLAAAEKKEITLKRTNSKAIPHRQELSALRQEIQSYKVRSTRINNVISKIENDMLPNLVEDSKNAIASIENSGVALDTREIIDHEVACMKRSSRLVAKLKEPFLPFALRDNYKLGTDIVNSREALTASLEQVEYRDPILFTNKLIAQAKRKQRILVRKSPFIFISPACGILGFVLAPRSGNENGRIVLPGYFERSMISEETIQTVFADFRFDCSKADAGVDVMTSDTLVAAYATYRWNMRKKNKEVRKKAAIYLDETERVNWRRHYKIYMKSAVESGKFLFYKSPELYDCIINNFVDLPAGCEKLKR